MNFARDHAKLVQDRLDQLILADEAPIDEATPSNKKQLEPRSNLQNYARRLQIIKELKPTPRKAKLLVDILDQIDFDVSDDQTALWHLLGSIASQVYEVVLDSLLASTVPFDSDQRYWDDVASSHRHLALYSLQTSPLRLWDLLKNLRRELRNQESPLQSSWQEFYRRAHNIVQSHMVLQGTRVTSPLAVIRDDVQKKQTRLEKASSFNATTIGLLLANCFCGESFSLSTSARHPLRLRKFTKSQWQGELAASILNMSKALCIKAEIGSKEQQTELHEAYSNSNYQDLEMDTVIVDLDDTKAYMIAQKLKEILEREMPEHTRHLQLVLSTNGRPHFMIRYWILLTTAFVFSGTALQLISRRRAAIKEWIRDFGSTTIAFLTNWVLDPIKKIIGTIRHDETSEVSIMSKRSLEGDRASLERMVLEFANDESINGGRHPLDVEALRTRVREGDLTPILKAYEKDIQRPFYSSIRGNLIRALLIQIQKTKVDIEVAMNGIDSILKSQELVFGFVGLTPGLLVCAGVYRWLGSFSTSRRNQRMGQSRFQSIRTFRNIDRLLATPSPNEDEKLAFDKYGKLVCESIILRDFAQKVMPKHIFRDFLTDFNDLIERQIGATGQRRVAERMRWAYKEWFLT